MHHRAKLTPDQVRDIRRRFVAGESQGQLAREFGVAQPTVKQIVDGGTWRHLIPARRVTAITKPGRDGWVRFELECGHRGRMLLGYPDGDLWLRQQETLRCWTCGDVRVAYHVMDDLAVDD